MENCHQPPEKLLNDLFDSNGFLREQALQKLDASHANAVFFKAVLQRLNDWVPQVRRAAQAALQRQLLVLDLDVLLDCLPAIIHLQRGHRDDHKVSAQKIEAYLFNQLDDDTQTLRLLSNMQHNAAASAHFLMGILIRYALTKQAQQHTDQPLVETIHAGLCSTVPSLARSASLHIAKLQTHEVRMQAIAYALASRQPAARIGGLRALQMEQKLPPSLRDQVAPFVMDRSPTARKLAVALLGSEKSELLQQACSTLTDPHSCLNSQAGALGLLADLGQSEGKALVLKALQHPESKIRSAAYNTAFHLQALSASELITRSIRDESTTVFRIALLWSKRLDARPSPDALLREVQPETAMHWQRILRVNGAPPWSQLALLFKIPSEFLNTENRPWIDMYSNRALNALKVHRYGPSDEEIRQLKDALPQFDNVLGIYSHTARCQLHENGIIPQPIPSPPSFPTALNPTQQPSLWQTITSTIRGLKNTKK